MTIVEAKWVSDIYGLDRPVSNGGKQCISGLPTSLHGFSCGHQHLHTVLGVTPGILQNTVTAVIITVMI